MLILIAVILLQETILVNGLGNICNPAKGRPTSASTAASKSGLVVDGDRSANFFEGSCWEAATNDMTPYWMVDLGKEFNIQSVSVTNRLDCCWTRLHDFAIEAFLEDPEQVPGAPYSLCHSYTGTVAAGATESLNCFVPHVLGRYLRVRGLNTLSGYDRLTLCEVEVCADLGPCFEYSFIRQSGKRNTGAVTVIPDTSRADCATVSIRHSTCVTFNYNIDSATCEMVTVSGALVSSAGWDHFQIDCSSN